MELAKRSVRRAKGTGRYLPGLGLSCLLVLASFSGCYLEPGTGGTTQPARTPVLGATSTSQPGESEITAGTVSELTITVAEFPDDLPAYDRDDWLHWIDEDDDCQNTRHEVLIDESRSPVTYKNDRQCQVKAGLWLGKFTGATVTEASELDIDHLVPLANAHRSGGWAWTPERKQQFANSLGDPGHLIAVTSGANRSKGAKSPDQWRPPDESYWCEYATDWTRVKSTWQLTATRAEARALGEMLQTCDDPPDVTVVESDRSSRAVSPAPTAGGDRRYPTCDEAERAGEERVQGSKGQGRGFPKPMVPGALDGDGDGVVCER